MKKIALFFTILIAILVATSVSVYKFVDINDYKAYIITAVKEKTEIELNIKGDIRFRILPDFALNISDVSMKYPNSRQAEDSIDITNIIINLKLLPLLQKDLEIASLKIVSPKIKFIVFEDGSNNFLEKIEDTAVLAEKKANESPDKNYQLERKFINENIIDKFKFSEIILKNAEVTFIDERNDLNVRAKNLDITTSFLPEHNIFKISGNLEIENHIAESFNINGKYRLSKDLYELSDLILNFGKIEAHGEAMADFHPSTPDFKLAIYFTNIDLTPYSSLVDPLLAQIKSFSENENAGELKENESFSWNDKTIDFSELRTFNCHFSFKSNKISYNSINVGSITLNSYLVNGKLTVSLKEAEIIEGNITGELIIDTTSGTPKIRQKLNFEQVDFATLPIQEGLIRNLSGKISGGANLTSRGVSQKDLIRNIDGNISFKIDNGSIKGVDLLAMSQNVASAFSIDPNSNKKTDFKELAGEFDVNDGIIKTDHFIFTSDILNFNGVGITNLPELTVNFKMVPKIRNIRNHSDVLGGIRMPIIMSGNLLAPSFRLEIKDIVEDFIKNPEGTDDLITQFKKGL